MITKSLDKKKDILMFIIKHNGHCVYYTKKGEDIIKTYCMCDNCLLVNCNKYGSSINDHGFFRPYIADNLLTNRDYAIHLFTELYGKNELFEVLL